MELYWEIMLRLLIAVLLGGLIGFERGKAKHEAGLRTHILVCLGAATIMALSELLINKYEIPQEMMRMGAQVVSGVGFLGAGSIMSDSNKIRGITTAAGVWTTACVGLVIGSGYYIISITITLLMLFAMIALKPLTKKISSKVVNHSLIVYVNDEKPVSNLMKNITDHDMIITRVKYSDENDMTKAELSLKLADGSKINDLVRIAGDTKGIKEFNII